MIHRLRDPPNFIVFGEISTHSSGDLIEESPDAFLEVNMHFVNTGYGNYVDAEKIITVIEPKSAPVQRKIKRAESQDRLINSTYGRRVRSVLFMNTGEIILSAVQPETIVRRANPEIDFKEIESMQDGQTNQSR